MPDHLASRTALVSALRAELVGPCPCGKELDCSADLEFASYEAAAGPFRQNGTGEEILTGDRPVKRYGVGVLYPMGIAVEAEQGISEAEDAAMDALEEDADRQSDAAELAGLASRRSRTGDGSEDDDLPLSTANSFRPSSFGLSFVVELPPGAVLTVKLSGGRYTEKPVAIKDRGTTLTWWTRVPVDIVATFDGADLLAKRGQVKPRAVSGEMPDGMEIELSAVTRPTGARTLLTVSAINRSSTSKIDSTCLFQAAMRCSPEGAPGAVICPYEEPSRVATDDERDSLALLYRDVPAFAIGHGCAADWHAAEGARTAESVLTAALPAVEVPSTTPDITGPDGSPIKVPMKPLAGLDPADDGNAALQAIVDGYSSWIAQQANRISGLEPSHQATATAHLATCTEARDRMQDGISFLTGDEDPAAALAFRLANHAMLLQQQRSGHAPRATTFNRDRKQIDGRRIVHSPHRRARGLAAVSDRLRSQPRCDRRPPRTTSSVSTSS